MFQTGVFQSCARALLLAVLLLCGVPGGSVSEPCGEKSTQYHNFARTHRFKGHSKQGDLYQLLHTYSCRRSQVTPTHPTMSAHCHPGDDRQGDQSGSYPRVLFKLRHLRMYSVVATSPQAA